MSAFIRFGFWGLVALLGRSMIVRSKLKKKRRAVILLLISTAALWIVFSIFPLEYQFLTFSSPEKACRYREMGNSPVQLVVEGEETAAVIAYRGDRPIVELLLKAGDRWKLDGGFSSSYRTGKVLDAGLVRLYRYRETREYYLCVTGSGTQPPELKDSRNTEFQCSVKEAVGLKEPEYVCCGYLRGLDSGYTL